MSDCDNCYIEMLKELRSRYEFEIFDKNYSELNEIELKVLIGRRVRIKTSVLPTIEFLIKDLKKIRGNC